MFVQPGKPLEGSVPNAKLFVEHDPDDVESMSGKIVCDTRVCHAGCSIPESLDFLFKLIWVFGLEYPARASMFFRFLQFKIAI